MIDIVVKPAHGLLKFEVEGMAQAMSQSYYQSQMALNFHDGLNQNVKQLCAYAQNGEGIIGACVVKEYNGRNAHPICADYPNIYFKHMAILPEHQSKGVGAGLVKEVIKEAFDYFNTHIIWSGSSELGALKFYNRLGAWFSNSSIESANPQISSEENRDCLKVMMQGSQLNKWRLPQDIMFAWARDDSKAHAYLTSNDFQMRGLDSK